MFFVNVNPAAPIYIYKIVGIYMGLFVNVKSRDFYKL
jgi:hypothetical protein